MEVSDQLHAPATVPLGKRSPKPAWMLWRGEKSLACAGCQTPIPQLSSLLLCRLNYPSSHSTSSSQGAGPLVDSLDLIPLVVSSEICPCSLIDGARQLLMMLEGSASEINCVRAFLYARVDLTLRTRLCIGCVLNLRSVLYLGKVSL
jgi:hypothetical protein